LPDGESGIFSRGGLDRPNQLDLFEQIKLRAHRAYVTLRQMLGAKREASAQSPQKEVARS